MQIIAEVDALKKTMEELTAYIETCKQQQKETDAECKRLEKEMNEFKDNKDSKLKQLKVELRIPFHTYFPAEAVDVLFSQGGHC